FAGDTSDATTANVDSTTEELDDTTNDGATQATDGATQTHEDHTHATDGATQAHEDHTHANDGATHANDGATQANEDHTHANDGATQANDGVTGGSIDATTDSNSGLTCYSCGNYSDNMMAECKPTGNKTDCPDNECWIYRNEKDGAFTYARGCRSTDDKAKSFQCSGYKSKLCKTVDSVTLCAQCCTEEKCNTGDLVDIKSSAPTSFSGLFLAVAAATVVVSLTK
ncbi:hypothetical protein LSAT2_011442, partial [Lamellibrachia satsuma]